MYPIPFLVTMLQSLVLTEIWRVASSAVMTIIGPGVISVGPFSLHIAKARLLHGRGKWRWL